MAFSSDKNLGSLEKLTMDEARGIWRKLCRREPPPFTKKLLLLALAYKMQEREVGGLDAAIKRHLKKLGSEALGSGRLSRSTNGSFPLGTQFIRDWHGQTYHVCAVRGGFEFEGKIYSSLSRISKLITGVVWSGPRFFGLRSAKAGLGPTAKIVPREHSRD